MMVNEAAFSYRFLRVLVCLVVAGRRRAADKSGDL